MKKILIVLCFVLGSALPSISLALPELNGAVAALWMNRDLKLQDPWTSQQMIHQKSADSLTDLYKVIIEHPGVGRIQLMAKGPKGFLTENRVRYRSLMIASGFFTGDQSIHLIGNLSNRVLVGFEYPHGLEDFQNDPGTILQFVRKTPGQIAIALKWLSRQSWVKPHGVSVMGVSLGGVFLPSGLHLTQSLGVAIEKSIYVCTGVDLNLILRENLRPYTLDSLLNPLAAALAFPTLVMDPQIHLPYLRGKSLVIQTDNDTVIPRHSQQTLWVRLAEPKRGVILNGPHVNADQTDVIKSIQETILKFDME